MRCLAAIALLIFCAAPPAAGARAADSSSSRINGALAAASLSQALRPTEEGRLLPAQASARFDLTGRLYDGSDFLTTGFGNLADDARSLALLLDGTYALGREKDPHPFVSGGLGVAMHREGGLNTTNRLSAQNDAEFLPLFRMGAGMNVPLAESWDLQFQYQAGIAPDWRGDTSATPVGAESRTLLLQQMNMGMKYRF